MDKAQQILSWTFPQIDWKIEKPKDGMRKECYIAKSTNQSVFIKFDVPLSALKRLGEIGVSPKVLKSGEYQNVSYVIQEFIDGTYPDRAWIKDHIQELAKVIKTYHEDRSLIAILSESHKTTYQEYMEEDLELLSKRFGNSASLQLSLKEDFLKFNEQAASLQASCLVPIHNEPNTKNMLISEDTVIFIDWDEIMLSDPMRDIGTFLWWYLPEEKWSTFFDFYGAALDEEKRKKIYWYAVRASLVILLWEEEHGVKDDGFMNDFTSALHRKPNPRGY